ncbi:MAG: AMP-binding protein [Clostridia bacterium]|nr:AMP-binding protein [Clostridia bacterium]
MKKTDYEKFLKKAYKAQRHESFKDIVYNCAEKFADELAFQIRKGKDEYRFITFAEVKERFLRVCNYLLDQKLEGQCIAMVGPNSSDWCMSYLAAATVGVAVPLDKELHVNDVENFVKTADCKLLFAPSQTIAKLKEAGLTGVTFVDWDQVKEIEDNYSADATGVDALPVPTKDEMRVLIFTSGTSGKAKGVCLSQHNICSNIYGTSRMVGIKTADKTLSILPLHHTYECTLGFMTVFSNGGGISFADGLTRVAQNMAEYQPSIIVVVPALLQVLDSRLSKSLATKVPEKYKKHFETLTIAEAMAKCPFFVQAAIRGKVKKQFGGKLRLIIVGGAEVSPHLVEDFNSLGFRTLQGYGLTECSPLLVGNNDFYLKADSTGLAIPGVTVKIDEPNEEGIGEILATGENIMLGYYEDPEANAAVFTEDGFFRTGDLGRIDDQGYVYITGRKKNVIVTSNGKNIYPEELESRLQQYDIVQECLVVAAKDKNSETCVKAKVYPNVAVITEKLGHEPTYEEQEKMVVEMVAEINGQVAPYKRIRITEVLRTELEKTTTRKIKRFGNNLL